MKVLKFIIVSLVTLWIMGCKKIANEKDLADTGTANQKNTNADALKFGVNNENIDVIPFLVNAGTPNVMVSTVAGTGIAGYTDGFAKNGELGSAFGLAFDNSGNLIFGDQGNHAIRKISTILVRPLSTITGLGYPGYADGVISNAKFNGPTGTAVNSNGDIIVADMNNHVIRKISTSGVVTTIAGSTQGYLDGPSTVAKFNHPFGLCVDAGDNIYVSEYGNHTIRKISVSGNVTTIAGNGTGGYLDAQGTLAKFYYPYGLAINQLGEIFVADAFNRCIRKISSTGMVSTVVGSPSLNAGNQDGSFSVATFYYPTDVKFDLGQNSVYVCDYISNNIRKLDLLTQTVTTVAGSTNFASGYQDGIASSSLFNGPQHIGVSSSGDVFIGDCGNHRIRKLSITTSTVSTVIGDGIGGFQDGQGTPNKPLAQFNDTHGVSVNADGSLLVADFYNGVIRQISPYGLVTTLPGNYNGPNKAIKDANGNVIVGDFVSLKKITPLGQVINIAGGTSPGYANGTGSNAAFRIIQGIVITPSGDYIVSDANNSCIRYVTSGGVVSTIYGSPSPGFQDGFGVSARFSDPCDLEMDASGNIYVADFLNDAIRKISTNGFVSTIYQSSGLKPIGLALDGIGNLVICGGSWIGGVNNRVLKMNLSTNSVSLIAGGNYGYRDGLASNALFYQPADVAIDPQRNIYVADGRNNNVIRKITGNW